MKFILGISKIETFFCVNFIRALYTACSGIFGICFKNTSSYEWAQLVQKRSHYGPRPKWKTFVLWKVVKSNYHCSCTSICSECVHQISWENNGRRRPNIWKWAFLQVPSLILWFRSTLPLLMQIYKDKKSLDEIKQKSFWCAVLMCSL